MSEHEPTEPSRQLVWERVKQAAQAHHDHYKERGTSKLISIDADVSPQYVSDWKAERSPIPMATLSRLASLYGVSTGYLAGYTDDANPRVSSGEAATRATMVALVDKAVSRVDPNADHRTVSELCSLALELLNQGKDEATVLGTLFLKLEERRTE